MKIVHLCTMDSGGAGKAVYRLHKGLQAIGLDSTMLVISKKTNDPSVVVIPSAFPDSPGNRWASLFKHWNDLLATYPQRPRGLEIFTDTTTDVRFDIIKELQAADVIGLYWVAGLFDYEHAVQAFKGKKIIWRLSDMNPFTGGCHYAGDCLKYQEACGSCPQLGSSNPNDLSRKIFERKASVYNELDITVVTPSRWLGTCSSASTLFGKFRHEIIPTGIPLNTFQPLDRNQIRTNLQIPPDARVVLFGADYVENERKGFRFLLDALKHLKNSIAQQNLIVAIFGNIDSSVDVSCGYKVLSFGPIADEEQMAQLYNAADVFVLPSLEDNLPNTMLEALACGTPVAAFNIGGVPDMVDHGVTGYLAPARDVTALAYAIEWCTTNAPKEIRLSCRAKAESFSSLHTQAHNYKRLYEATPVNPIHFVRSLSVPAPKISVVTPSYNQADYLEECIDSILSQHYPNLEYIIMDGGSTDGSVEIIKKHEKHLAYWQSKPDGGQYAAINEGFRRSTGEIMAWLNSDDKYHPGALHIVAAAFSARKDIEWITGRPTAWDDAGKLELVREPLPIWSYDDILTNNFSNQYIQQESTFWKRTLWEKAGAKLDESYKLAADFELWAKFFRHARLFSIDALLGGFRSHSRQKTAHMLHAYKAEAAKIVASERHHVVTHGCDVPNAPEPLRTERLAQDASFRLTPAFFTWFSYSKLAHFSFFGNNDKELYGTPVNLPDCDLKKYQDLLVYTFICENIPKGSRLLEIGGGDSRILKRLADTYECWNIDKMEGIGNGPTSVSPANYRLIRDYMGEFNRALPDGYFDFVFSISALEHVKGDKQTYEHIRQDIDRVMKPGAHSLHCFDVVMHTDSFWTNPFLLHLFKTTQPVNPFVPFDDVRLDPSLFCMTEKAYANGWQKITKKPYHEFGRPFSYNILWQKKDESSGNIENARNDSTYSVPLGNVTIATSIMPGNVELQKTAVSSWKKIGFRIISVNSKAEISQLQKNFPDVQFVESNRNAAALAGKPLIYLDDILVALEQSGSAVCGIVNSDIILDASEGILTFVTREAHNTLLFGTRTDVVAPQDRHGEEFAVGLDYFFFDKDLINTFKGTDFCLGAPWWDYWLPLVPLLYDIPVKQVASPFAFHVKHATKWIGTLWASFGDLFLKLLSNRRFDAAKVNMFFAELKTMGFNGDRHSFAVTVLEYIKRHATKTHYPEPCTGNLSGVQDDSLLGAGHFSPPNHAHIEKQREFWNTSSLYEAMFERVFVDGSLRHASLDEKIAAWNRSAQESMTAVLRGIPWQHDWKVLEIGCGVGRIIKPMREVFSQVDGVDIAEAMVAFAQQYLAEGSQNGAVIVNNGSDLQPLTDENYDLVFSMIVFQHIRSASVITSYLRETFRVLKPGGYFRLQVFDTSNPHRGRYDEEASGDVQYGLMGNGYTPEQLRALLNGNGFEVLNLQWNSPWIWATARKPSQETSFTDDSVTLPANSSAAATVCAPHYKVSAIVSTYNSESFLRGCLDDLTGQTLYKKGELEIVVIDSGSEQGEQAIVEEFQRSHSHIVYQRTERETLYAAWNRGIAAARGIYLTNANTDDRHHPEALEILANILDSSPGIDLAYANCKESRVANQTFAECPESVVYHYPEFFPPRALLHFQFGPQPMWRKSVHNSIGMFDSTLRCVGDYDFNIRFALKGLKAKLVPRILGLFYLNPTSITNSNPGQQNEKQALLRQYWTEENILVLFKHAGWAVESPNDKAIALTYLAAMATGFSLPWSSRKDSAPDLTALCKARAASYLQPDEVPCPPVPDTTCSLRKDKKIAFFAGDSDNFHFVQPIMHYLANIGYEVAAYRSSELTREKLADILREASLAWFEWGNGPIIAASHLPKSCPIVCRVHRYEVYSQLIANINWLNVDRLIFVNQVFVDVFKELVDRDIERKTTVKVIPNPVREDLPFKARTNNFRIAYISRFQADKNPALMLQILAKLVSIDSRYCVHMIGRIQDVQLYQYCLRLVEKLGLQRNFFYEGTRDDVPTWLDDKSFFLSTSIVESQGLALMEAMMMGLKPVIHDSFGSLDTIYGLQYLFRTVDEAVQSISASEFNSHEYHDQIASRYSSSIILPQIEALVQDLVSATPPECQNMGTTVPKALPSGLSKQTVSGAECPICGSRFNHFEPYGTPPRPNALCPSCHSLERHRLLWLYLKTRTDFFSQPQRVLDVAPMKCISERIRVLPNIDYLSIDQCSSLAMRHMDITALDLPDNSFNCIICYHVLEHVPDDHRAMKELFRVLSPGGWAIIQVPINLKLQTTFEGRHISDPQERKRLFGLEEHVRIYGCDYVQRLADAGFKVHVDQFARSIEENEQLHFGLSKDEDIYLCKK